MKFTDQILFDLTDIDNEIFKIQCPLDYEKDKKPLQHPRIKELQKQDNQIINMQNNMQNDIPIPNTSLSKKQSRQAILEKWKQKRTKLIFRKKKITCVKKSEYAKVFKKRGPNGRFVLIKK